MSLFGKIGSLFATTRSDERISHAATAIENNLGPHLLATAENWEALLPAVTAALDHYDRAIATIPGPLPLSASSYALDQRLHTLFPSADDVDRALGASISVRNGIKWFADKEQDTAYALLGLRLMAAEGGSGAVRPVDHTIRSLGIHAPDTRTALREAAFAGLIKSFTTDLYEKFHAWRAQQPAGGLEPIDPSLVQLGQRASVAPALRALAEWLRNPERQFALEVANPALLVPAVAGEATYPLPRLVTSDRRKWLVCLVAFQTQEAIEAIEGEARGIRYIQI
ncbi:MAG: hypothetical protein QMD17_01360 [Rhodocyclaceae bacterium]|nr:hypothetical protein [Rhodocyclaceae bacterium]